MPEKTHHIMAEQLLGSQQTTGIGLLGKDGAVPGPVRIRTDNSQKRTVRVRGNPMGPFLLFYYQCLIGSRDWHLICLLYFLIKGFGRGRKKSQSECRSATPLDASFVHGAV
jgi:hypothetical protein